MKNLKSNNHLHQIIMGIFLFSILFLSSCTNEQEEEQENIIQENSTSILNQTDNLHLQKSENKTIEVDKFTFYKNNYQAKNVYDKIVDNYGNGHEALYGTRNFRPVLHGVLYRGGANNYYHRTLKRDNHNPLSEDGLDNLCQEGFALAVYLYQANFITASKIKTCQTKEKTNMLNYIQKDYNDDIDVVYLIQTVHKNIQDQTAGPIYIHCWNGWHASGYISAIMLRQFCGYSSSEGVKYWDIATDGSNDHDLYNLIRQKIKDFIPMTQYQIDNELRQKICPEK